MSSFFVLSRERILILIGGLLMASFQLRFAFDGVYYKLISVLATVFVLGLLTVLVNGSRGVIRVPYGVYAFFLLYLMSCVFEVVFSGRDIVSFFANIFSISALLFYCSILLTRDRFSGYDFILRLVASNLAIYIFLNIALLFFGVKKSWADQFVVDYESGKAVMLGALGIDAERVYFLLSNGVNSYGAVTSLAMGVALIYLRRSLLFLVLFFLALATSLLIDSRSSFLFCGLALLMSWLVTFKGWWRLGLIFSFLIPMFPLVVGAIYFLAGFFLGGQGVIFRTDADAGSIGGRSLIWAAALDKFSEFSLFHIFGYGNAGQVASGISAGVGSLQEFSNYVNADQLSMHNAYIQALVNYGYLGFFVFSFLLVSIYLGIAKVGRSGDLRGRALWGWLFCFYLILFFNNTESPIIYPGQLFIPFFVMLFVFSYGARKRAS